MLNIQIHLLNIKFNIYLQLEFHLWIIIITYLTLIEMNYEFINYYTSMIRILIKWINFINIINCIEMVFNLYY